MGNTCAININGDTISVMNVISLKEDLLYARCKAFRSIMAAGNSAGDSRDARFLEYSLGQGTLSQFRMTAI